MKTASVHPVGHYTNLEPKSHNLILGYVAWLFGFFGCHRFYFGRPISGIIWALTFGLLGIGWIVDLFLIPGMEAEANVRYPVGKIDYSIAWALLVPFGVLGLHRFYLGKWITGIIYLLTGGLFLVGWIYDLATLNEQVAIENRLG